MKFKDLNPSVIELAAPYVFLSCPADPVAGHQPKNEWSVDAAYGLDAWPFLFAA